MNFGEFTKSGAFVAMIFALVAVSLPFGIEQVGETSGWFSFPVRKLLTQCFSGPVPVRKTIGASGKVDWERYRQDLEEFTRWAEGRPGSIISLPPTNSVVEVVEDVKPKRRIWHVPIVSCTAADPVGRRKGYVFIAGFSHPFSEGAMISASDSRGLCGYEIVFIGERTVWFRAVFDDEGVDVPMGSVKFPEFTRVDGSSLVKGNRSYSVADAFQLPSGGWLYVDSFLPPDGTVFKILDRDHRVVASMLCVIIGEKGERR